MQTNQTKSLNNYNSSVNPYSAGDYSSKSLGYSETGGDYASGCVAWLEQNSALLQQVHQAMMSGNTQGLGMSDADIQTLLGYEQYANSIAYGSNWGGQVGGANGATQPPVPGNMWYDSEEATISAIGDGTTHNSSAYENTLNVPSTAAEITYDVTTDTRTQPAVEVLRVTIKNKQTGQTDVVYFDNFRDEDFSLTINSVKGKHVSGTADGVDITVGEYDADAVGGASSAGGITGGTTEEVDATHTKVVAGSGETIDIQADRDVSETQYIDVYGNANLMFDADMTGDISVNENGDMVITYKNVEGKEPEILAVVTVKKGFTAQVNHDNWKNAITIYGNAPVIVQDKDGNDILVGPTGLNMNGELEGTSFDFHFDFNIDSEKKSAETDAATYPAEVNDLAEFLGVSAKDLEGHLQSVYGSAYDQAMLSVPADQKPSFLEWFKGAGLMKNPDDKMVQLLIAADPTLASLYSQVKGKAPATVGAQLKQIQTRLVALLNAMHPGTAKAAEKFEGGGGITGSYDVYGIQIGEKTFNLFPTGEYETPAIPETPTWNNVTDDAESFF